LKPLIFTHHASPNLVKKITQQVNGELAQSENHEFPDGESYVRIHNDCSSRNAIIIANLHQPNPKILPLIFLCETLKALGIESITLISPYLPYMRQDIQFKPGEGITSRFFAELLSTYIDKLITIDPHLHRYNSLDEIYSIPSTVIQAIPKIVSWIKTHIEQPLIVGPDSESEQWAALAADMIQCPYIILEKKRLGDKNVQVSSPQAGQYKNRTPVLIDDIISTGRTMIKTAEALVKEGLSAPICIGVHAIFSDDAYEAMKQSAIQNIITCNTVPHQTNQIDLSELLAAEISALN